MHELHCDFETASRVDLRKEGLDNYARHESTKVLMLNWSIDDGPVNLWLPHERPIAPKLRDMMLDPSVRKIAHNAQFEIAIFNHVLGIETVPEQWYCTMVMALHLGLPAALEQLVRDALRLPKQYHKDPEGDRLMRLFSYPKSKATHETHPEEFKRYCDYGRQDVVAETKVYAVLKRYVPNMGQLFSGWVLDQKINARGLPVDYQFIDAAKAIAAKSKEEYKELLAEKTGLQNSNSVKQLLPWLEARGYPFASTAKNRMKIALKDFADRLTDECKEVMQIRMESNKTSLAKYDAILRASHGGRLRNTFQYYGAAATGRWAGRILGQNMPRPDPQVEEWLPQARRMILDGDLDGIKWFFGKPLEALASSIRSAIAVPPGKKLVVADLASIELCVIAWLTHCVFWLDVVESGKDAYKAFAERWLGIAYEHVTKLQRKLSKPPALGCGYRLGAGYEVGTYPDTEKTGLWGYAANMGVDMTKEQCRDAVKIYRELSPEIKQAWYDLENAAMDCVSTGERVQSGMIVFDLKPPFLRMRLPSGRYVHYCRPRIEEVPFEYEDEETGEMVKKYKTGLTYERLSQSSKKWVRRNNHGGRFVEQAVQAIARDLLEDGIKNAEKMGFEVIGHYHDEILTLVDEDSDLGLQDLIDAMTTLAPWAETMCVRAAGYESDFYKKD